MTTEPQAAIHYLTVQDILWINHEATREVLPYKYSQLEEATFGQYAYGESSDVISQAARFLSSFGRLRPFEDGNRATAFIAVLTFLSLNGYTIALKPESAIAWFEKASGRASDARGAVLNAVAEGAPQPMDIKPAVRTAVRDVMKLFPEAIAALKD